MCKARWCTGQGKRREQWCTGRGDTDNSGVSACVCVFLDKFHPSFPYLEIPDLETPPQGDPSKAVPLRRLGFIFVDVTMTAYSTLPSSCLLYTSDAADES